MTRHRYTCPTCGTGVTTITTADVWCSHTTSPAYRLRPAARCEEDDTTKKDEETT